MRNSSALEKQKGSFSYKPQLIMLAVPGAFLKSFNNFLIFLPENSFIERRMVKFLANTNSFLLLFQTLSELTDFI